MSRDGTIDDRQRLSRRFCCDGCGLVVVLHDWRSRPDGWFTLMPPAHVSLLQPLEIHVCSERCGVAWLQDRVEARATPPKRHRGSRWDRERA